MYEKKFRYSSVSHFLHSLLFCVTITTVLHNYCCYSDCRFERVYLPLILFTALHGKITKNPIQRHIMNEGIAENKSKKSYHLPSHKQLSSLLEITEAKVLFSGGV